MKKHRRIVIKVGTKVIAARERGLDLERIADIARQVSVIMDKGTEVLIVTSGAIGAGMALLKMKKRPTVLAELQAAAAVGQGYLMHVYRDCFKKHSYDVGQILLTQEDFNDRARFVNIKHTVNSLLKHKAIPVINENDTVATDEIKCGDNDRLSSLVADLCEAEKLIVLTDVDGLLDKDGRVISLVPEITRDISSLGGKSACDLGTGGMATKIEAARAVTRANIECVVANGRAKNIICRIMDGENCGTVFTGKKASVAAKKRWIAYSSRPKGSMHIDDGAKEALIKRGKSLLASGITSVTGNFDPGDTVCIVDRDSKELGRGIAGYSSEDIGKIKGHKTQELKNILGKSGPDEVINRDDLVIL